MSNDCFNKQTLHNITEFLRQRRQYFDNSIEWLEKMARKKCAERSFECFLCHTTIQSKLSNLKRHMKLHESVVFRLKCPDCSGTFQNKVNFGKHWGRRHKGPIKEAKRIKTKPKCKSL